MLSSRVSIEAEESGDLSIAQHDPSFAVPGDVPKRPAGVGGAAARGVG